MQFPPGFFLGHLFLEPSCHATRKPMWRNHMYLFQLTAQPKSKPVTIIKLIFEPQTSSEHSHITGSPKPSQLPRPKWISSEWMFLLCVTEVTVVCYILIGNLNVDHKKIYLDYFFTNFQFFFKSIVLPPTWNHHTGCSSFLIMFSLRFLLSVLIFGSHCLGALYNSDLSFYLHQLQPSAEWEGRPVTQWGHSGALFMNLTLPWFSHQKLNWTRTKPTSIVRFNVDLTGKFDSVCGQRKWPKLALFLVAL